MVYEDFTTYTEVDPNSHITKSANHIDFLFYRNEDAYVYTDKGSEHFTNFSHNIQVRATTTTHTQDGFTWVLSNDIDDFRGLYTGSKTAIGVELYASSGTLYMYLVETTGGAMYNISQTINVNTYYYLTITKSGTSLILYCYSDAARTNLLWQISLTLHGDWSFRYVFGCNTYNTGHNIYGDADIDDLDLQEPPWRIPLRLGQLRKRTPTWRDYRKF